MLDMLDYTLENYKSLWNQFSLLEIIPDRKTDTSILILHNN